MPEESTHPELRIAGSRLNWSTTATDYAKHRAGFPPEMYDRLARMGVGLPGQRVLDLGTGTGTVARSLAARGCDVVGLDPAEGMLEQARELAREAGLTAEFITGRAEDTGLPAASFDGVTAGQCWHWFDRPRAAAEVMRLLRPGGWLALCHFDWIPLPGNLVDQTEKLIIKHNPAWKAFGGLGLHPGSTFDVGAAGFRDIETFSFDEDTLYTHESWRGRIRASAGISASLSPEQVAAFDAEHAAMLADRFPEEPVAAHHRCWVLVCRKPR